MSTELPFAGDGQMRERRALAQEFWSLTHPELAPWVSDEATWYSFDFLDTAALLELLEAHYGVVLEPDQLAIPFWELLDYLDANRRSRESG